MAYSSPKIIMYGENNFQGRPMEYTYSVNNLQLSGFNNEAKSLQVVKGVWLLYENKYFEGKWYIFVEGQKVNLPASISGKVSSLHPIYVNLDDDPKLFTYSGQNFTGDEKKYTTDVKDLGCDKNKATSVRVAAGGWVAYDYPNYQRTAWLFPEGLWSEQTLYGNNFDNKISSLRPIRRGGNYNPDC